MQRCQATAPCRGFSVGGVCPKNVLLHRDARSQVVCANGSLYIGYDEDEEDDEDLEFEEEELEDEGVSDEEELLVESRRFLPFFWAFFSLAARPFAFFSLALAFRLSSLARSLRCFFPALSQPRITCQISLAGTVAPTPSSSPQWARMGLASLSDHWGAPFCLRKRLSVRGDMAVAALGTQF